VIHIRGRWGISHFLKRENATKGPFHFRNGPFVAFSTLMTIFLPRTGEESVVSINPKQQTSTLPVGLVSAL
jgi:hypothetical protein